MLLQYSEDGIITMNVSDRARNAGFSTKASDTPSKQERDRNKDWATMRVRRALKIPTLSFVSILRLLSERRRSKNGAKKSRVVHGQPFLFLRCACTYMFIWFAPSTFGSCSTIPRRCTFFLRFRRLSSLAPSTSLCRNIPQVPYLRAQLCACTLNHVLPIIYVPADFRTLQ